MTGSGVRVGCVGATTIDTLLFIQAIPTCHDQIEVARSVRVCLGGKGMIAALTLHVLGQRTRLLTCVGSKDEDRREIGQMLPSRFCSDYMLPVFEQNNRTWIMVSHQQEVITLVNVPQAQIAPTLEESVKKFLAGCDIVYISFENRAFLDMVAREALAQKLRIVFNPSYALLRESKEEQQALLKYLVGNSSALLMNEGEAKVLQSILEIKTWQQLTGTLREIVITRGGRGGRYIDLANDVSGTYKAIPPAAILCSVGAGDTFAGAFLKARFIDGLNLAESCRYSAMIASQKLATAASSLMELSQDPFQRH